jgi:hypothetical protein
MKVQDTLHRNSANLVEFSICIKKLETGDNNEEKGKGSHLSRLFDPMNQCSDAKLLSSHLLTLFFGNYRSMRILKESSHMGIPQVQNARRFQGPINWLFGENKVLH